MIRLKSLLTEFTLAADDNFRKKVKSWEGPGPVDANGNHLAYDDENPDVPLKPGVPVKGTITIGYGTTDAVLPTLKPGMKITPAKAEQLLTKGIQEHEAKAIRLVPRYKRYPKYVQEAILNAIYRGDLGPKTIETINKGEWNNVSTIYLQHPNYTNPGELRGVVKRMKSNADAFDKYAAEIQSKKATKKTKKSAGLSKTVPTTYAGKTVYPKPGYGYTNVRSEDYVDNGIIDNLETKVYWPNPIGRAKFEKIGQDGKKWLYVTGENEGWVRTDVVKLNNSPYHTVKPGETFLSIALANGFTLSDLQGFNQNLRADAIKPGDKIKFK